MTTKQQARQHCRSKWKAFLSNAQSTSQLLKHLADFLDQLSPNCRLLIYIPLADELDYLHLLAYRKLDYYAPRVLANGLEFRYYKPQPCEKYSKIEPGYLQIPGPRADAPLLELPLKKEDCILFPALGLRSDGRRLGRGGGYYDRWCAELYVPRAVTLMPSSLCCIDFPLEAHDTRIDEAITETGMIEYS